MGAWGSGPFENDDAMDFVGDLEDAGQPLEGALLAAMSLPADGYLEAPDAAVAVAAAALVALVIAKADGPNPTVDQLLSSKPIRATEDLRQAARSALDRVLEEGSEWRELWEEADLLDEATGHLEQVRRALETSH